MSHIAYFATNCRPIGAEKRADFGRGFNPDTPAALRSGQAEAPDSCFGDGRRLKNIRIEVAPENLEVPDRRKPHLGSAEIADAVRRVRRGGTPRAALDRTDGDTGRAYGIIAGE